MMAIVKKMSVGKQNKPMHKNKNGPKMSISKKKDPHKWYWEYGQQDKETRRKFNTGDILENAARCKKCGDYVRSNHRHDFRSCSCGAVSVDGGSWYARRLGCLEDYEDIIIMYDDVKAGE